MKALHDSTVSLYVNFTVSIVMLIATYVLGYTMDIFGTIGIIDWVLFLSIGFL